MSKEYIEREAALHAAKESWAQGENPECWVEAIPAADVVEVRHGEWEKQELAPSKWKFCSCCGFTNSRNSKWNYCPNCGAKMDGGPEHDA